LIFNSQQADANSISQQRTDGCIFCCRIIEHVE
jgi:hypothetical protein